MKKMQLLIMTLFLSAMGYSQVIIGGTTGTASNNNSILLDFAPNQQKGIILPYVRTLPSGTGLAEGTIVLDASDLTKAKVKYYNGSWVDLSSDNTADITSVMTIQPTAAVVTEDATSKAIIGAASSVADGVLVLESASKTMVLPMINDTNDVLSPAQGMMVYVNKSGKKKDWPFITAAVGLTGNR